MRRTVPWGHRSRAQTQGMSNSKRREHKHPSEEPVSLQARAAQGRGQVLCFPFETRSLRPGALRPPASQAGLSSVSPGPSQES